MDWAEELERNSELREAVETWNWLTSRYGKPEHVDNQADLYGIEPRLIWTEYWRSDQFIVNEYDPENDSEEITGYYVFEKPYKEEVGSLFIVSTVWETCHCQGDDSDCEDCDGKGAIPYDLEY